MQHVFMLVVSERLIF